MPLQLSRKPKESIVIGDDVVVTALECRPGRVRLSIDAPRSVKVMRAELVPHVVPTDTQLVRSRLVRLAHEWSDYTAGGLDVCANACLDEVHEIIAAVRA